MVFTLKENLIIHLQRKQIARVILLAFCIAAYSASLWAQGAARGPVLDGKGITPIPLNPESEQDIPTRLKRDIIYMPDSEGKIRPVPLDVTMEKYLEWLDREDTLTKKGLPSNAIENLVCKGNIQYSANGDPWAFLSCQLEIGVQRSPQWQFILLDMKEATLGGITEKNSSAKTEEFLLTREGKNNQWVLWYRNRNQINVVLSLLVPVQVTGAQKQLTLSLPAASRTEMQFQIDHKDVKLDLKSKGFDAVEQNDQGTLLTIKGFNQLVDFVWSPETRQSDMPPAYQVDSQIYVSRSNDSTSIQATQTITMQRGSVDSLKVRIPSPFNIVSVKIPTVKTDQKFQYSIGTDRSLITLIFQEPIEKSVQIDWELTAPVRKFESELLLDGFDVLGAKTQTGKIGVLESNDWRIGQIPSKTKNIYQMNVRQIAREGEYSQAYQFYGQPWQLALATQRTQARYTLETFYDLHAQSDSLQLTVDFEITPRNGTIELVQLQWPEFTSDQWTIEEIVQSSTGQSIIWSIDGRLELPDWNKKDTIRLVASRKLQDKPAEMIRKKTKLPFSLPRISTTDSRAGQQVLRITSVAGPYELILDGKGFEKLTAEAISPSLQTRKIYAQAEGDVTRQSWYHISNVNQKISFAFSEIIRKVSCESEIQIQGINLTLKKVSYRQVFNYMIAELPSNQFILRRVDFDHAATDSIRVLDENGNPLETEICTDRSLLSSRLMVEGSTVTDVEKSLQLQPGDAAVSPEDFLIVKLPQPVLGMFKLTILGEFPLKALPQARIFEATAPVYLPFQVEDFQLKLSNRSPYKIEPLRRHWELQLSEEMTSATQMIPTWKGNAASQQIDLQIDMNQSRLNEQVGVVEGRVDTWISWQGKVISELVFDLARTPPVFSLKNVKESETISVDCHWIPSQGSRTYPLKIEPIAGDLSFLLPDQAVGQSGKLIVKVVQNKNELNLFGKIDLIVPDHSLARQIAWIQWRVHLPDGAYLFSPPGNFSPDYSWRWKNWGFRRLNNSSEIASSGELTTSIVNRSRNSYSFTSIGWPGKVELRCIGRGLLMALGTGIPLLIAVFFTGRSRDDKLRGSLLIFAITGGMVVLFPEQMALLAQPALIGVFFTVLATWVAGKLRSHHEEPTLIIIGASHTQGDEQIAEPNISFHGVAGDEITRVQPPPVSSLGAPR